MDKRVIEEKKFNKWNQQKKRLHFKGGCPNIKNGEIWWCGIGQNIGVEINGKSDLFLRPVIVYQILGKYSFLGIPLTSQKHDGSWYVHFRHRQKDQYAVLCQTKAISRKRLYRKMGQIDRLDMKDIATSFEALYVSPYK